MIASFFFVNLTKLIEKYDYNIKAIKTKSSEQFFFIDFKPQYSLLSGLSSNELEYLVKKSPRYIFMYVLRGC